MAAFEKKSFSEVIRILGQNGILGNESLLLLIKSNANLGRLGEARKLCSELVALNPGNSYFYYLEASILIELKEEDKAAESLRKALYIDNDMALAHFLLGNLLRRKGLLKLAQKHYLNVLERISEFTDDMLIPLSDGLTAGYFRGAIQSLSR